MKLGGGQSQHENMGLTSQTISKKIKRGQGWEQDQEIPFGAGAVAQSGKASAFPA